ncbi:MAG: FecR family protein [Bacteriovorax sp.]
MKLLVLFTILFSSTFVSANQVIGSIAKIKGHVSILELGNREAKSAVLGQSVSKEASILTSEKSFVQIILLDKTQINVGPSSKIVLDQTPAENIGLINLLKGALRTEVVKELGLKDKLYIKTRTAALGVRGTDFQTSFNPENRITNLITFRGKVAMAKTESDNFQESLASKGAVMVEVGKFAAISENLKNATEPVKISPIQYTALKLNAELNEDAKVTKEEFHAELQKTIKEYGEISKKEMADQKMATHEYDVKNQVLRPTAGGVVDLSTGIYVPPTIDQANFNKDLNIYELKAEKGIVTEAGNYVPPKGVILDAKKGFIVDPQSQKTEQHVELTKLNNDISGQIIRPAKPNKEDLGSKSEDAYEKYFIKE